MFFNQKRSFNLQELRIIMNQFVLNARQSPIQTPSYLPFFHSTPYFEQNHYFLNPKPLFLAPMPFFSTPRTYAQPLSTSIFSTPDPLFSPPSLSLFSTKRHQKNNTLSLFFLPLNLSFFYPRPLRNKLQTSLFIALNLFKKKHKPLFSPPSLSPFVTLTLFECSPQP